MTFDYTTAELPRYRAPADAVPGPSGAASRAPSPAPYSGPRPAPRMGSDDGAARVYAGAPALSPTRYCPGGRGTTESFVHSRVPPHDRPAR